MKEKNFTELCEAPISALQGIAEWTDDLVSGFPRPVPLTIGKLGKWKYFLWARAITVLAEKEIEGKREKGISININKGLDVAHEHKSLKEICAPMLPWTPRQGLHPARWRSTSRKRKSRQRMTEFIAKKKKEAEDAASRIVTAKKPRLTSSHRGHEWPWRLVFAGRHPCRNRQGL